MRHDIAYKEADKGIGRRHDADKAMLNELNGLNISRFNRLLMQLRMRKEESHDCTVELRTISDYFYCLSHVVTHKSGVCL